MSHRFVLPVAAALALSACAGGSPAPSTQAPVVRPAIPASTPRPTMQAAPDITPMNLPGLDGVIGATASQLGSTFGPPRLDVVEGDVRKLQWVGEPCVLDVYLYPNANGAQVGAYVDARRASDGRDVDRAACVRALRR